MDWENRSRADLRLYEQGRMYAKALDEGLYPSLRRLAEALGVDSTNASRAVSLARLPAGVLAAFASPLDIQYRWASDLVERSQKDPDAMLASAQAIAAEVPRPQAKEVFERLVAKEAATSNPEEKTYTGVNGTSAVIRYGKGKVKVTLANLSADKVKKLNSFVENLLR